MRKFLFAVVCGLGAVAMGDTAFREGGSTFGLYEEKDPSKKDDYLYQERMKFRTLLEAKPVTKADTNLLWGGTEKFVNELTGKGRFGVLRDFAHRCRTERADLFAPYEDTLFANEICAAWRSGDREEARRLGRAFAARPHDAAQFAVFQRIHGRMNAHNPTWVDANGTWSFLKELSDPLLADWQKALDDRGRTSLAEMRMVIARACQDRATADRVYAEMMRIEKPDLGCLYRARDRYLTLLAEAEAFRAVMETIEAMPPEKRLHETLAKEYIRFDRRADAVKELDAALAYAKIKPDAKYELLVLRAFATAATPEAFAAALPGVKVEGLDELTQFRTLRRATRALFNLVGDDVRTAYVKAAATYSRTALMHAEERLAYDVVYLKDAPRSAGAALAGDVFARLKTENRFAPYQTYYWGTRANEEKLLKGRPAPKLVADKPGEEACAAVAYDETGLHVYLRMNDPEAWKAKSGLARGWGLEFEVQPGDGEISHWIMVNGAKPANDTQMDMAFPHDGYKLGDDYIRTDAESTSGCHVVHVYVPWVIWDGKLPEDGETWRLSMVADWGKNFASLGGGSVHEVQRGLAITFRIPREARAAIRRGLLDEAAAEYRAVRDKWESAEFWSDPHLGDEPFYEAVVKPYLAATDAVDAKIREGKLTDAEVEATLKESFADLADFRLRLDAKRTEWIRGNLFK